MTMEGILPVRKPEGYTSHDVVAKVRRILGIKRIGHTGTLDPSVTGVLPLCIGRATRVVEYIQDLPKEYEARLVVGIATDTEDLSGTVVRRADHVNLTEEQIRKALIRFVGEIEQIPPMYSAVKVEGKRLYELAREGIEVKRQSRKVTVYSIELTDVRTDLPCPEIAFRVLCSKGTYIRTLCSDLGVALGYPAVMSKLVRTATGGITLDRCLTLEEIEALQRQGGLKARLIPADQAVSHIPSVTVNHSEAVKAMQGKTIKAPAAALENEAEGLVRLYEASGRFLGFFRKQPDTGRLAPEKVFS